MEYGVSFCHCVDDSYYMYVKDTVIKLEPAQVEVLKNAGVKFTEIPF